MADSAAASRLNIDAFNQLTSGGTNQTITFAPGGFATLNTTINVTGGNGYSLALGPITSGNSGTLTLSTTANTTLAAIPGSVTTFTKGGSGTLTLPGSNAYTAATTVEAPACSIFRAHWAWLLPPPPLRSM